MSLECGCFLGLFRKLLARGSRLRVKRRACLVVNKPDLRVSGHYDVGDMLGEGAFGKVSSVKGKKCGRDCVLKVVDRSRVPNVKALEEEVAIHAGLDHPNIVRVYETFADQAELCIIMELCRGGDLEAVLDRQESCSEPEVQHLFAQVVQAVHYMHCQGVAHRDLKPENFIVKENDLPLSECTVKLIDFGFAARFDPSKCSLRTTCGTPQFMAPEVLSGAPYDHKCDVWSCGVILHYMLCGALPFDGEELDEIFSAIRHDQLRLQGWAWRGVSKEARSLVSQMCRRIVQHRSSAQDVLEHPWLKQAMCGADVSQRLVTSDMIKNAHRFGELSDFEKASLHRVAYNMEDSHVRDVRQAFLQLDTNRDGTLDKAELLQGVGDLPAAIEGRGSMKCIFDTADFNRDGSVDYTEFLAAMMGPPESWPEGACVAAFRSFDSDNSGCISVREIRAALEQQGTPSHVKGSSARQDLKAMLSEIDADGDGEISFSEFMDMLRRVCRRFDSGAAGMGGA